MWVMLNDSFLSIVAHRSKRSILVIRARRAEDISLVFPQARLIEGGGTDYEFRALVKRSVVQRAMAREVERIDYHNFKELGARCAPPRCLPDRLGDADAARASATVAGDAGRRAG